MNKFFTVDIKPTITASKQHDGTFGDGDLLFDWTAFNVPSGVNKLVSAACMFRGTDGAAQTFAVNMYFAKTIDDAAPSSLGDLNATANYDLVGEGLTVGTKLHIHPTAWSGSARDADKVIFLYKSGLATGGF